jgi:inhibitor of KinA
MEKDYPQIKMMGERSILIQFEPEISENVLQKVLKCKQIVENIKFKEKVEVINAYNSISVNYVSTIENAYSEVLTLKQALRDANIGNIIKPLLFHIPVCYDLEFGLDLDLISKQNNLEIKSIIELHTAPIYTVYFIGFLPGFLYLGGLDKRLQISRKNEPRLEVQNGAVGIGENQTGIYPKTSPGGWQIIGNSPVPLFNKNSLIPCEISSGDKIKFFPVSRDEYDAVFKEVESGKFNFKKEDYVVSN